MPGGNGLLHEVGEGPSPATDTIPGTRPAAFTRAGMPFPGSGARRTAGRLGCRSPPGVRLEEFGMTRCAWREAAPDQAGVGSR